MGDLLKDIPKEYRTPSLESLPEGLLKLAVVNIKKRFGLEKKKPLRDRIMDMYGSPVVLADDVDPTAVQLMYKRTCATITKTITYKFFPYNSNEVIMRRIVHQFPIEYPVTPAGVKEVVESDICRHLCGLGLNYQIQEVY